MKHIAMVLLASAAAASLAGTAYGKDRVIHVFGGSDGSDPRGKLIEDKSGYLYGTTFQGGAGGDGIVFRMDQAGTETVLHAFNGSDGANPTAGVIPGKAGVLYGTASAGGAKGHGVVFRLTPGAPYTYDVLHTFSGGADGGTPYGGVIADRKGNLYGAAAGGGSGHGLIFEITRRGKFRVLYDFQGGEDGDLPTSGLVIDASGNLFTTTFLGGANSLGTIFELSADRTPSVLHSFDGDDGEYPEFQSLSLDGDGNLYSVTPSGGAASGGEVFEFTAAGEFSVLHSFNAAYGYQAGGYGPSGGVVRDRFGALYGTTTAGGLNGAGAVYRLAPDGTYTVLHNFTRTGDGSQPAELMIDPHGRIFGTTHTTNLGQGNGVAFFIPHAAAAAEDASAGDDGFED